ncbi:hypothetical protein F383_07679 [Gossypium arboreum]|uniref:Uncharacterized protein n=1 Tax=Gossypium arboreum TaxID=29729 RepID=A0A0B0PY47_GOSAR|nr:hypothetical protein F383_07679 [Gossypium arboreum]
MQQKGIQLAQKSQNRDIETIGGSGIVEDYHYTIKLNFGTF